MKKIIRLLACVAGSLGALLSCNRVDPEVNGGEGNDDGKPEIVEMPVVGLQIPEAAHAGSTFVIKGEGFPENSEIYLQENKEVRASAERIKLQVKLTDAGAACSLGAEIVPALYDIFLVSGKHEWQISKSPLSVLAPVVKKRLTSVTQIIVLPEGMGGRIPMKNIDLTYDKGLLTGAVITDAMAEVPLTFVTSIDDVRFSGNNTEELISNDVQGFEFVLENGRVKSSTFTLFENKKKPVVEWEYEADGTCTTLAAAIRTNCDFEGAVVKNNPYGADAVVVMDQLLSPVNPVETNQAIILAGALGLTGTAFPQMPANYNIKVQQADGSFAPAPVAMTYQADKDGYVTSAAYTGPDDLPVEVVFEYEAF